MVGIAPPHSLFRFFRRLGPERGGSLISIGQEIGQKISENTGKKPADNIASSGTTRPMNGFANN